MNAHKRIDSLTSLRFFAAALIVVGHGGNAPGFHVFQLHIVDARNGVTFFFVLSGFILAYTYDRMAVPGDICEYAMARIARIWPLHLVTLAAAAILFTPGALGLLQLTEVARFLINALLVQAWIPYSDWYYSYNAVSWSLSTEVAFYAALPALVVASRRHPLWPVVSAGGLFVALAIATVVLQLPLGPSPNSSSATALLYISPLARVLEFTSGMLAWQWFRRRGGITVGAGATLREIAAFAAALLAMIAAQRIGLASPSGLALPLAAWIQQTGSFPFFAVLIAIFARQEGRLSRVLTCRPLVYMGEVSFALYMCHQLVLKFLVSRFGPLAIEFPVQWYVTYWCTAALISVVLFEFVEGPCRRWLRKSARSRRPARNLQG